MVGMSVPRRRPCPAALLCRNDGVNRDFRRACVVVLVSGRHSVRNAHATIAITVEEAFVVRRAWRLFAHACNAEPAYFADGATRVLAFSRRGTSGVGEKVTARAAFTAALTAGSARAARRDGHTLTGRTCLSWTASGRARARCARTGFARESHCAEEQSDCHKTQSSRSSHDVPH